MAETSLPWANNGIGDGQTYDDDEWSDWQRKAFTADRTTQGPIAGYLSELLVANPSGYTLRVPTGAAWVDGKFYENTANLDLTTTDNGTAITAPVSGTNYYTLVLRKTWATQLVRAAVLDVSTVAYPTVTQTDGTIWEIALANFSVTSGGVKTVTDVRKFANSGGAPRFAGRQGGSATDWNAVGTSNYFPVTDIIIQCGSVHHTSGGTTTVTFPKPFSAIPNVRASCNSSSARIATAEVVTATTFQAWAYNASTGADVTADIEWLAIGPA